MNALFVRVSARVLALILCTTVIGCAGSKSTVVKLPLTSQLQNAINVMPFNKAFEREYYSDANLRGGLIGVIATEIDNRTQLYTYTFDDADLINLRVSIIKSLTAANYFIGVNDIQEIDDRLLGNGLRLYIDFESMGVSGKYRFICEIKAHAKVSDVDEKVLAERDIHVREKGEMTLMAAKNKAIEVFIVDLGILLGSI